jgi:predicted transcriptional regulator
MSPFIEPSAGKISIVKLAQLRLLLEKIPRKKTEHNQTLLYIMESFFYKSEEEISQALNLPSKKISKIIQELAKKRLIEKNGCLCRQKPIEEILSLLD